MKSGIYVIKNTHNDKVYVGSSFNIQKRWDSHLSSLRSDRHHSCKLQGDYNLLGESSFYLEIVEETNSNIKEKEDGWISDLNSKEYGYNIGDAVFGDALTYHPNRDDIIKRRTETANQNISNMSDEERVRRFGKFGSENGNWNENLVRKCTKCGGQLSRSTINRGTGCCINCRDRSHDKNPFLERNIQMRPRRKLEHQ